MTAETSKEKTVHDHELAQSIFAERKREMERHLRHRMTAGIRRPHPIRRAFGHSLIQIGTVIAADGRLRTTT